MRVLLLNPYYPISEGPSPALGLAFLGASLEQAGVTVKVLDLVVFPYTKALLRETIETFQPDMVGATAVTMTVNNAVEVIADVKSINSQIVTVMGGPHVTFCAEETLEQVSALDCIVLGEGEATITELVAALADGREWDGVDGIVFRGEGGVCRTAPRKGMLDVTRLPVPARHLLPLGRYRALGMPISMTTSRGCPFQCIFCVGRKMVGAKVRYRNPMDVVDELEHLGSLGFPQINIADDLFTANKKHCSDICDEIVRRGLVIKWSSFARVDTVSPEVLRKMKSAGCDSVSFGIETANADILKRIKKGITVDQVVAAVKMCNDAGIQPSASFILGLPGETPETIEETVAFGLKLKEMGVIYGFHLLAPFPGTRVREKADEYGLRILTDDWREYHANEAIVETEMADKARMDAVAVQWQENIDTWLADIDARMKAGRISDEEAFPLVNLQRTVAIYDLMMKGALETTVLLDGSSAKDEASLEELAARLAETVDHDEGILGDVLRIAYANGSLICRRSEGQITWGWNDYL
jgi:anaerobic magnesium-protoporphyrin IX monomethyl ester cyclase